MMLNFRSPNPEYNVNLREFVYMLKSAIDDVQDTIICGDFNYDFWGQPKNMVSIMLKAEGFQQVVKEATTIHGKCIDHVYVRSSKLGIRYQLHYPHYSDHECVCFMLKKMLNG